MKGSESKSYAAAGVDITAGYKAVELMKKHIATTMTKGVCSDIGSFGGLFELDLVGVRNRFSSLTILPEVTTFLKELKAS